MQVPLLFSISVCCGPQHMHLMSFHLSQYPSNLCLSRGCPASTHILTAALKPLLNTDLCRCMTTEESTDTSDIQKQDFISFSLKLSKHLCYPVCLLAHQQTLTLLPPLHIFVLLCWFTWDATAVMVACLLPTTAPINKKCGFANMVS